MCDVQDVTQKYTAKYICTESVSLDHFSVLSWKDLFLQCILRQGVE